jgi:prepilin-type N-terminal cleavage/methylation domain-containing protein
MTQLSGKPRRIGRIRPGRERAGFSLLELMVSIALVLLLILGINQVFGLSSRTVGAGQALSEANRDARNAQSIFFEDARGVASALPDAPCLIIRSQGVYAFRNKADLEADADQNPTTQDLQGDGKNIATYRAFDVNERRHRLDQLFMFARGVNHRQTGTGGSFGDLGSSFESYIVYGHLALPNNGNPSIAYRYPGEVDPTAGPSNWQNYNPNNYFASQWVLGRSVFLLDAAPPAGTAYYQRANLQKFSPLSPSSVATTGEFLTDSRYDLCEASIDTYRQIIARDDDPVTTRFWQGLTDGPAAKTPARIRGNPVPPRPLNSADAARAVPCFLRGCTQFVVEYAGDFCTQDPTTGLVTSLDPDGIIDYIFDPPGKVGDPVIKKKVRWYGFPRDVTDDGAIDVRQDVVPLADFVRNSDTSSMVATVPLGFPAWERVVPSSSYPTMPPDNYFLAAWGPDTQNGPKPTMIRITTVLDDADGRIGAGQSFEYVLKLQ